MRSSAATAGPGCDRRGRRRWRDRSAERRPRRGGRKAVRVALPDEEPAAESAQPIGEEPADRRDGDLEAAGGGLAVRLRPEGCADDLAMDGRPRCGTPGAAAATALGAGSRRAGAAGRPREPRIRRTSERRSSAVDSTCDEVVPFVAPLVAPFVACTDRPFDVLRCDRRRCRLGPTASKRLGRRRSVGRRRLGQAGLGAERPRPGPRNPRDEPRRRAPGRGRPAGEHRGRRPRGPVLRRSSPPPGPPAIRHSAKPSAWSPRAHASRTPAPSRRNCDAALSAANARRSAADVERPDGRLRQADANRRDPAPTPQ